MLSIIIAWLLIGAIAGWLAAIIMGMNEQQGGAGNIMIGIVGALLGGFISRLLGGPTVSGINLSSIIIATLGSVILLFFVGAMHRSALNR